MHNTIINIGRSFGSGGGFVGQEVARKLGIPFYDNERISRAAEENGYAPGIFAGGEQKRSIFSASSFFASGRMSYMENAYMSDDVLFKVQSEVIRSIARKGDAVIIGRCADYILRDLPCLNVFVTGPLEYRIGRLVETEGLSAQEAEKLIRKKDRTRETYYNYYTFGAWGHSASYHLCIDSSVLGIEGSADSIIDFGRRAGLIR